MSNAYVRLFASRVLLILWLCFYGHAAAKPGDTPNHAWDIGVIDRALASAKPGEKWVRFGDVGIKPEDLKVFRDRLVAQDSAANHSTPSPEAVTPAGTTFKWRGGSVYYRFDPVQIGNGTISAAKMQQFRDGVAEWAAFAKLNFNEFTGTPPANYITVQEDAALGAGGFSSSVGMAGGEQFIKIGPVSWSRRTVGHEMCHALGFYHEQQRPDRDTFVTINTANIQSGAEGNFAIISGGLTHGAYDFYSIMHYARDTFSSNGQNAIDPKPAYTQFLNIMGSVFDRNLSKLDRAGMAIVYGDPLLAPGAVVTNTKNSGEGSLRTAIYFAFDKSTDAPPVPTTIVFNIPTNDAGFSGGVFTIKPTSELDAPGAGTTIDGSTQTTFTGDTNPNGPEIVLDGSQVEAQNLGFFAAGLRLREMNCEIKNLVINGFNTQGILFDGTTAAVNGTAPAGNVISGCYIGTDKNGTNAVGNGPQFPGIELVDGAHDNTIGGTTAAGRNIISGNTGYGVTIHDTGCDNNVIEGNYIGLNAAGTSAVANGFAGVNLFLGAQNNTVGGTTASARNVISGNKNQGIQIVDAGTNGNIISGNYIGLNAAGTSAVGNGFSDPTNHFYIPGIDIFGGPQSNIIGGTTAGARNIISGNGATGVNISGSGTNGNIVEGNYIGTNPAGTAAMGNGFAEPANNILYPGVAIFGAASSNIIGGAKANARNIISGNASAGINISGTGTKSNKVEANFIGTKANGAESLANAGGVNILAKATKNTIGGTKVGMRNVISGNQFTGVTISGVGTKSNKVLGNYIGTDSTGGAALANTGAGISIFGKAQSNTIGGTTATARNVISGNQNQGITINDSGTNGNKVLSNYIGVNAGGTAAIPNSFSGVEFFGGPASNTIGAPGQGNVISGNGNYGVALSGAGTSLNSVQANLIGLNAAGTSGIGNALPGVILFNGPSNNTIGGSAIGAGNTIAFNAAEGIAVFDNTTTGNDFNANSIFSNSNLGINLSGGTENGFGVTTNDAQDPDSGPNQLQNYPVLSSANSVAVIQGSLNSVPNKSYRIDFFSSAAADPSGFGEGQGFIGSATVTTNGSGNAAFNVDFLGTLATGSVVTATATGTGSGGPGTSEFSAAVTVTP